MRISDWSSDVCSSDLQAIKRAHIHGISIDVLMYRAGLIIHATTATSRVVVDGGTLQARKEQLGPVSSMRYRTSTRSEEHTSELQSLMRISYAVFCLKTKNECIYYRISKALHISI